MQIFEPNGKFKSKFGKYGTEIGELDSPTGLCIDLEGNIVVCDDNHRVQTFTSSGVWLRSFGKKGYGSGELYFPVGVAVDPQGRIIVVEHSNHRVQVFSPSGQSLFMIGEHGANPGCFYKPWGISVDKNCLMVICDQDNHRIQVLPHSLQSCSPPNPHLPGNRDSSLLLTPLTTIPQSSDLHSQFFWILFGTPLIRTRALPISIISAPQKFFHS